MPRRLAIKKLRASDLTFFRPYFAKISDVKQKALNLNASILVGEFFPNLEAAVFASPGQRAPVTLTIFGPNGAPPQVLERKILKQQKNWRLNGELVYAPEDDLQRYDRLQEGDIAVMEFSGTSMPHAVRMVLLSATDPNDQSTHAALDSKYTATSMAVISEEELGALIQGAATPDEHPINDWLNAELLESLGSGDSESADKLLKLRPGRGLTDAELKRAKESAERVGKQGEDLLNFYFEELSPPDVVEHHWSSSINAISPYDFRLLMADGTARHADAKSTSAAFSTRLYLSMGEIRHALTSKVPYDIYRLYQVTESAGTLRIAKDVASKLTPIFAALKALPSGVQVETLAFEPSYFEFEPEEISITFPEDEQEE